MGSKEGLIGGFWTLERTARCLSRRSRLSKPLPHLLFFTDPQRTPDPERIAERLPRRAGIVFRPFGAPDADALGRRLAAIARRRGLILLAGADPTLARRIGAAGVHLPERLAHRAGVIRRAQPLWIVTAAAHSLPAARRAIAAGAHAVVISPAFPSRSPSAGRPLGAMRLSAWVREGARPAYALGGVSAKTAGRLLNTGVVGAAAVEALA
ncbi:thiamine phosphate synthase [Phenylobacterium sp.]|uniref:thiamine phosphate synthase n=1 Tax=Phenylobacterium sp. TaxID=1871053 RepID=UPI002E2EB976|nr:thiamine phosphate synthase [Phenylobacterium sp.]HEX2561479.1 thiamine phosphate synthase [Phenylobacterium sp.]